MKYLLYILILITSFHININKGYIWNYNDKNIINKKCKTMIIETIPLIDFNLKLISSPYIMNTIEGLISLVNNATKSIDITSMYWNLLGLDDIKDIKIEGLNRLGIKNGKRLYESFINALNRNVKIRIIVGNINKNKNNSILPFEIQNLINKKPNLVSARIWDGIKWYGGGIMHMKLWIIDSCSYYIGSANMDWKSLSQVQEVGIILFNCLQAAIDAQKLFNSWWKWSSSSFNSNNNMTDIYYSVQYQTNLKVPIWSNHINKMKNPFLNKKKYFSEYNHTNQLYVSLYDNNKISEMFLSASPMEIISSFSRTNDEKTLIYTIQSAIHSICLSVMDYIPISMYPLHINNKNNNINTPIYWPILDNTIMSVLFTKNISIKLLISKWKHSTSIMFDYLKNLQNKVIICKKLKNPCIGKLEIRIYSIPGWNHTYESIPLKNSNNTFATFSRVNHAKYIVTDNRVNIGTNNMEWGYFYTTAGASFNTNDSIIRNVVQKIFDRNWYSNYSVLL